MRDGRNLRKKKVRNVLAYRYYCMNSSPLAQHMPPDMVAYRVWGSRPYLPDLGGVVYGTLDYSRQLSMAEMNIYGLFPANVVQQPIMIQEAI